MIDMPANWMEKIQHVDWSKVKAAVADYGPVLFVLRQTWSKESLLEISQGKLFVPDDVINDAIAKQMTDDGAVTEVTIKSHENGRLDITANTKKVGPVEVSGEIREFVHQGDSSYAVYRVRSKNILNHGLMSWVFSRISLSMAERLVGHMEMPDNLPVTVHHNTVRVDYSKALAASDFGKTEYQGHRLIDMIEIEGATPKEGGVEFDTKLNVPDDVKQALLAVLTSDTSTSGEDGADSTSEMDASAQRGE
ncbi:hypothetical protein [uncultured Mitsuokella sp.]|uniref:hypothetical protein n=1 Tax=uncultured Mitsuokella sp. TaxID=453120 RepID=UPI0026053037|nr:hypothetical protein [uncultured Mitsuokella sp.]